MSPRDGIKDVRVRDLKPGDTLHGTRERVTSRRVDGAQTLVTLRHRGGRLRATVWRSDTLVGVIDDRVDHDEDQRWAEYDRVDEDPQAVIYAEEDKE